MHEANILKEIGLEGHEAKLYLALLELGETSAVMLAKKTRLHRRTVYDTLEKLNEKGLVNVKIKKFVKHYSPNSPKKLQEMLDEKRLLVKRLLPFLMEGFRSKQMKTDVTIFEGPGGMKTVFSDIISVDRRSREECLMLGAGLRSPAYMKYSFPHYVDKMKYMKWRLIEPDIPRVRTDMEKWGIPMNRYCRFLPARFLAPVGIVIYKDKTIIMLLEGEPVLIQINGKSYAKAFRNYFELLWRAAK